jgi:hypothetical protein
MARPAKVITASAEVRVELQRRAKAPTSAHRDRFRANIILLLLEGLKDRECRQTAEDIDAHGVDMVGTFRGTWPRRS